MVEKRVRVEDDVDEMPKLICEECKTQITNVCNFRDTCENNTELLLKILTESTKVETFSETSEDFHNDIDDLKINDDSNSSNHNNETSLEPKSENTYKCEYCSETCAIGEICGSYSDKYYLHKHLKEHRKTDDDPILDEFIKATASQKIKSEILSPEIIIKDNVTLFQCPTCKRVYKHRKFYNSHARINHTSTARLYPCTRCDRVFKLSSSLRRHQKNTHDNQKQVCTECGKSVIHLSVHIREVHDQIRPHHCTYCNRRFTKPSILRQHIREKHMGQKSYKLCSVCGKTVQTAQALQDHMRSHTGEKPFECSECGKKFRSQKYLHGHMLIHTGIRAHICSYCKKGFKTSTTLKRHVRIHTGECPYVFEDDQYPQNICLECSYEIENICAFQQKCIANCNKLETVLNEYNEHNSKLIVSLKIEKDEIIIKDEFASDHIESDNDTSSTTSSEEKQKSINNKNNKYFCTKCNKTFRLERNYIKHLQMHKRCIECCKYFQSQTVLEQHKREKHNGEKLFVKVCTICGKQCYSTTSFLYHMRSHNDENPYKCNICNKEFKIISHLNAHRQSHGGFKAHICRNCNKSFTTSYSLKIHMLIHTERHKREKHNGEKLFIKVCTICGKQCYSTTSFLYHMRSHNDENPYKCEICNKVFKIISHLNAHRQSHSGVKSHLCEHCNKSFLTSYALKKHSVIHTGERRFSCQLCNKKFTQKTHMITHMKVHKIAL
ncbi:zinc finger protein 595-like [Chrysoperla carnea]|uniref:zinc finger protein 595-like n=1 Tax=Chrysoperla carnea TaxID=189513 RepID=UPI001D067524|nr:zinc finger protein 595-like [Chrysoperla carnea]